MKIVMASQIRDEFLNELRTTFPSVTFQPAATEQEQVQQIQDADVFYGEPSREVFLAAEQLRWSPAARA